ncbi:unnamed protein product, partial [marine sediment metagenome]
KSKKGTNKKAKKEIPVVYPIFEKCAEISNDSYWESIFKGCSINKFPRHFYYNNGLITWKRGNKVDRVLIPDKDIWEVYNITAAFFRKNEGLYSTIDRAKTKEAEELKRSEKVKKEFQWKNIRMDRVKNLLIYEFINGLAKDYYLSDVEKDKLTTTIKLGLMLKYFKEVEMVDGKITNIMGLIYTENGERIISNLWTS